MAGHGPSPRRLSWLERWLPGAAARRERRLQEGLKAAAQDRSRTEALYARAIEAVPDGICVSRDGRVVFANAALAKLVGFGDPAEAVGRPTLDFVDADFHEMIARGRVEASDQVPYGPEEIRLRRVDGSLVPVELRVVALDHADGRSFLNLIRDLTAQKDAEAEAKLRAAVLDQATDGVIIANERGRVVYVNRAFCEMRNLAPGSMLGRPAADVFEAFSVEGIDVRGIVDKLFAGEAWRGRYHFTDETGERHRDTHCFSVRDAEGRIHSVVALVRDTTQEVQLEQQAEQGRKLEAVGQLAGGLAHDLSNLLTVILGHVEILSLESPADAVVQRHAQAIGEAAERSATMARQLLAFGRRRSLDPRVVDLAKLVRDQRELLVGLLPDRIALEIDLAASLAPVRVDPDVLQKALSELVMNARDAIEGDGTIRIFARERDGQVALSIEDDGSGMDAQTRERMFEPFFSTREVGAGAGLGLATTHGLVIQSGGSLEVDSEPGHGTCVRVLLPEARMTAPSLAAESPGRAGVEGSETLLVVEDEDRLRGLACRALAGVGYRVLEAADGRAALEVAEAHTGSIDLLVCDVILPGIDGPELAARLRSERPGLSVLLMSGYAPSAETEPRHSVADAHFLPKPFRMRDLRAFVREALDAPPSRSVEG